MLGAIIGDLAAWTWENDHEAFYPRLVSDKAKLSEYALAVLAFASVITRGGKPAWMVFGKDYNRRLLAGNRGSANVSALWRRWLTDDDSVIPHEVKRPLVAAAIVCAGWVDNSRDVALDWVRGFHCGKQEYYAAQISEVIASLLDGKTKKEAAESATVLKLPKFAPEEYLYYVQFAWQCFAQSWDFTSAIHNAMKCEGDRHLAAVLTGAIAEAMYGCQHLLLKKKYCPDGETLRQIEFPSAVSNSNAGTFGFLHGFTQQRRRFYPKNEALTNVEWHKWQEVENLYHGAFTEEQYKRILLSAPTSWDCRYGLYLDDGWIYVYRSCNLLGRFQFTRCGDDWHIERVQLSGGHPFGDFWLALQCALSEGSEYWDSELCRIASICGLLQYYAGESECPASWQDTTKVKFWHGERMFLRSGFELDSWVVKAKMTLEKMTDNKLAKAKSYSIEQFAIVLYIEELYRKWCPYDDMNWIFEY